MRTFAPNIGAVTQRALADLPAYLRRAHAGAIPFENLDILLGRPIRLDVPSLEGKLVAPQLPSDYEVANYHRSTHPDSMFTKVPVVQRTSEAGALALRGSVLQTMRPGEAAVEIPAPGGDALLALLSERFGLDFPAGTRFVSRT